jgi:DNA-binding NtrC family response regulator
LTGVSDKPVLLIIDPDTTWSRGISLAVSDLFSEVIISDNPRKALEFVKERTIHLIITEIRFRTMDGNQFISLLREYSPQSRIVICSAYLDQSVLGYLLTNCLHDIEEKPVEIRGFKQRLAKVIQKISE